MPTGVSVCPPSSRDTATPGSSTFYSITGITIQHRPDADIVMRTLCPACRCPLEAIAPAWMTTLVICPVAIVDRQEILRLCHDVTAAGHQESNARRKDSFCEYEMLRDAENYVSTCRSCSRNKCLQRHARAEMLKYYVVAPMNRVHLDFLRPLPCAEMSLSW